MTEQKITKEQLEEAFEGPIPQIKVTFFYKVALSIVSLFMILLPVLYVGIIAAFGYGIYYYAVNAGSFALVGGNDSTLGRIIFFLGPIISGLILIVFMIKPFFIRLDQSSPGKEVDLDSHPLLRSFIEKICTTVNAPFPKKVFANCDVNASASFSNGIASFFSNDLNLTIGLPLASNMSLTHFGGILAHEFGHFAQGTGMRFTYIIRTVNSWFYKAVYVRDSWDDKLEYWSKNSDFRIGIVLWTARGALWITRWVLWIIMILGQVIGGIMMRQMEYDADRYEIAFGGTTAFKKTTADLIGLGSIWQHMNMAFYDDWLEQKMADNIPLLVSEAKKEFNDDFYGEVEKLIGESKTGWFDTHPSDKDRVLNAEKENKDGIFSLDIPASELFENFEVLSAQATTRFYKDLMSDDFNPDYLVDTISFVQSRMKSSMDLEALENIFHNSIHPSLPITYEAAPAECSSIEEAVREIKALQSVLEQKRETTEKLFEKYDKVTLDLGSMKEAEFIVGAGHKINPSDFGLKSSKIEAIKAKRDDLLTAQKDLKNEYESTREIVTSLARYTHYALSNEAELQLENGDAVSLSAFKEVVQVIRKLYALDDKVQKVINAQRIHTVILINQALFDGDSSIEMMLNSVRVKFADLLLEIENELKQVSYELEQGNPKNMGESFFPKKYNRLDVNELLTTAQLFLDSYGSTYIRCFGKIGNMSSQIQKSINSQSVAE